MFFIKICERLAFDPHLRKVLMILFRGETIEIHFKFLCNFAHLFDPEWPQLKNANRHICKTVIAYSVMFFINHSPFQFILLFIWCLFLSQMASHEGAYSVIRHYKSISGFLLKCKFLILLHCALINIYTMHSYTQG